MIPTIHYSLSISQFESGQVCRDASLMALRKRIEGLSPEEIRSINTAEIKDTPITNKDFEEALSRVQSSVGKQDIENHLKWMNEFGSA
jgi:katanin p60 ATPase-containing subunit A1